MKRVLAVALIAGLLVSVGAGLNAPDNAPSQDKRIDAGAVDCSKGHTNPAHYGERIHAEADDCSTATPAPLQ
ncbi:MAG: hypothetical protein SVW77_01690 [Candidatus Nanohaloarchaea archaeon]|nr:hypothetical protein [Candidatus Nanohaloarchaea archaeon]